MQLEEQLLQQVGERIEGKGREGGREKQRAGFGCAFVWSILQATGVHSLVDCLWRVYFGTLERD